MLDAKGKAAKLLIMRLCLRSARASRADCGALAAILSRAKFAMARRHRQHAMRVRSPDKSA